MSYKAHALLYAHSQGALRTSTAVGRRAMWRKEEAKLPDMTVKVDRARGGGGG